MTKRNILVNMILTVAVATGALLVSAPAMAATCGGAETSIIDCGGQTGEQAVYAIIKQVIQILTVGIFMVAVAAVIWGGILYSSSSGSPDGVKRARDVWVNTFIGLLLYAFLVAITNFLIPGGVF